MKKNDSKVALITGGNRGLGFAVASVMARMNFDVILGCRDELLGFEAVERINKNGGSVSFVPLDLGSTQSVRACWDQINSSGRQVDVLINNAAVLDANDRFFSDRFADVLQKTMQVNFIGAVMLCHFIVPGMIQRDFGRIVNVSSGWGTFAEVGPESPAYRMSKVALNSLTAVVNSFLEGSTNVKINSVCPGWMRTRMGGSEAILSPEQSAEHIVNLVTSDPESASGLLFREGNILPW